MKIKLPKLPKPTMPADSVGGCSPPGTRELSAEDREYLKCLSESEFQAIDQFDKTVLTLTGGAFGVSFAFLKDIVKPEVVVSKGCLVSAWAFWCLALTGSLAAFYCSHLAMRRAQRRYREGERDEAELTGLFGQAVLWLNPITGGLFIVGLFCMSVFVASNLNGSSKPGQVADNAAKSAKNASTATTNTPAATTNTPAATTNTPAATTNTPAPRQSRTP
jgi:uncharacterized iron-regulated membrane protein